MTESGETSMSYEELVAALEATVERMSDPNIGIEEAVALYERAGRLHHLAASRLAKIQERIEQLTAADPDIAG